MLLIEERLGDSSALMMYGKSNGSIYRRSWRPLIWSKWCAPAVPGVLSGDWLSRLACRSISLVTRWGPPLRRRFSARVHFGAVPVKLCS